MNDALLKYVRAADYLSAIQIYLRGNFLLREPLKPEHLKPRLLGHWGTCPGINFTYAHLNRAIVEHRSSMLFVLGPGHGFPALQANLFLEGTLSKYCERVPRAAAGIEYLAHRFSWPYGFPSHSNPETPGVILEGGELGYALSTAYGAALDNPALIVACLIGDGEAETGPTAAAWHLNKLLDPAHNGAVLPILHLNGYKISGPTIMGRMSDEELTHLFLGCGYEPLLVDAYQEGENVHEAMRSALDRAIAAIHFTRHCAREGTLRDTPRWPLIILRTPKGWGGIKELHGRRIEDNCASHQVVADNAARDPHELAQLEAWLRSYRFDELFDGERFDPDIETLVPPAELRLGDSSHARGSPPHYRPLMLPDLAPYAPAATCDLSAPVCGEVSGLETIGAYLRDVMRAQEPERNLRLFSPDETYSNKLQAVFEHTARAFVWPKREWDEHIANDGRVLELLSEHSLQGLLQGYVLTGRHGIFASYEAFVQIVASMTDQYAKFLKVAREVPWRGVIPSLNYILTSTGWRQEHNGFSHQNPGFIDGVLQRQGCFSNVYFPADATTALVVFKTMLASVREINVMVCEKRPLPVWRTLAEAERDVRDGVSIWEFASDEEPHIVFAAAGDYPTLEALAAMSLLRRHAPMLRLRFVNITSLSALGIGSSACRVLPHDFAHYFTKDRFVIINFHGYPQTLKQVLFDYGGAPERFSVHGYEEVGSTTTPFDMMVRNRVDRFHLAMEALEHAAKKRFIKKADAKRMIDECAKELEAHRAYIVERGGDPPHITSWLWQSPSS
jgi:xylulose-5-phosphate/fructose-6-phosphate phosphoketolase